MSGTEETVEHRDELTGQHSCLCTQISADQPGGRRALGIRRRCSFGPVKKEPKSARRRGPREDIVLKAGIGGQPSGHKLDESGGDHQPYRNARPIPRDQTVDS